MAVKKPVKKAAPKKKTPAKAASARKAPVKKAAATKAPAAKKKQPQQRQGFKIKEFIVYPSHGVGQIVEIEEQEIAGHKLELFVIEFVQDKMLLRVPTTKVESVGMRKLSDAAVVKKAMKTLTGKARIRRTMWSRRAQEYESKINSGDLIQIAEVVRDLYRSDTQPEQSYSERQLYEQALDRMAREVAAIDKLDDSTANQKIVETLSRTAKAAQKKAEDAVSEASEDEGEQEQAA